MFPPRGVAAPVEVRSQRQAHWFWLDDILIDHHARFIGPDGVALYALLARHTDQETATCYPTIATMVERTGMSRNRVRRTLRRLATYGLTRMQEQPFASKGKAWTGYLITLLDPSPVAVSLRQAEGVHPGPPSPATEGGCTVDPQGLQSRVQSPPRGCKSNMLGGAVWTPIYLKRTSSRKKTWDVSIVRRKKHLKEIPRRELPSTWHRLSTRLYRSP